MRTLLPLPLLLAACPPPPDNEGLADDLTAAIARIETLEAEVADLQSEIDVLSAGQPDLGPVTEQLDELDDRVTDAAGPAGPGPRQWWAWHRRR